MIEDSILQRKFARPTGPGAGVIKYDVITALSVMALHDGPTMQMTVLRLIALITARYNWKQDQFCVAQGEMARMWNVSDRTVKREIKRMSSAGLIVCIRPGVRGRVGAYRLNYEALYDSSRANWGAVGPDFEARMHGTAQQTGAKVVQVDFAARREQAEAAAPEGDDMWSCTLRDLAREAPDDVRNWYSKLTVDQIEGDVIRLRAPSGFVASFIQTHLAVALTKALHHRLGRRPRLEIEF